MSVYSSSHRSINITRLDRETWAGTNVIVFDFEVAGGGELITEFLEFGTAYENAPFFTFGAELIPGQTLAGNYPYISCGVSEWQIKNVRDLPSLYTAAKVWVSSSGNSAYKVKLRFSFEGIAFQNPRDLFDGG